MYCLISRATGYSSVKKRHWTTKQAATNNQNHCETAVFSKPHKVRTADVQTVVQFECVLLHISINDTITVVFVLQ